MALKMQVLLMITFKAAICRSYEPTVILPCKKIVGSSSDINKIGNTLQCSDMRQDIKTCAQDCYTKDDKGENCVGFLAQLSARGSGA